MFDIWEKIKKYYRNHFLSFIKWSVFCIAQIIITINGILLFIFTEMSFPIFIFDWFIISVIIFLIIHTTFYFIIRQKDELQHKMGELVDSYEYIGSINRKVDELLDLRMDLIRPEFDQLNKKKRSLLILTKMLNILDNPAGHIHFLENGLADISYAKTNKIDIFRRVFSQLNHTHFHETLNTQNVFEKEKLISLGIQPDFFKEYNIVVKPVYLNQRDVAQIYLIVSQDKKIEERDMKIIRFFSFYLAIILCLKEKDFASL